MTTPKPFDKVTNPRFVLNLGSIQEQFPDMPEQVRGEMVLWDRQEKCAVVTIHGVYAQAICLEKGETQGISALEAWFNALDNEALESEGMTATKPEYRL